MSIEQTWLIQTICNSMATRILEQQVQALLFTLHGGASPDAWVEDPYCNAINGIAEFKCPYTKADAPLSIRSSSISNP